MRGMLSACYKGSASKSTTDKGWKKVLLAVPTRPVRRQRLRHNAGCMRLGATRIAIGMPPHEFVRGERLDNDTTTAAGGVHPSDVDCPALGSAANCNGDLQTLTSTERIVFREAYCFCRLRAPPNVDDSKCRTLSMSCIVRYRDGRSESRLVAVWVSAIYYIEIT